MPIQPSKPEPKEVKPYPTHKRRAKPHEAQPALVTLEPAEPVNGNDTPFEVKMGQLTAQLKAQFAESIALQHKLLTILNDWDQQSSK